MYEPPGALTENKEKLKLSVDTEKISYLQIC